jgi:hypothetical protein
MRGAVDQFRPRLVGDDSGLPTRGVGCQFLRELSETLIGDLVTRVRSHQPMNSPKAAQDNVESVPAFTTFKTFKTDLGTGV